MASSAQTGSPEPASGASERILVIRPGAMGDILRTLPAVHCLRTALPHARIQWLVFEAWREILQGQPGIDELIELRRSPGEGIPLFELARRLRRERLTLTLDFQGTLRSGLLARLSGCSRRFGFARGHSREGNFLFNNHRVVPASPYLNRVQKNLALVGALGVRTDVPYPGYRVDPGDRRTAEEWLRRPASPASPIVLMIPGSSRRQAHKRWPPVHFSRLAALLRSRDLSPWIAWGPGERGLAEGIAADSGGAARILPASRPRQLAAAMLECACVVAGDTGPLHMASAIGVPAVGLFGGTDPRVNAPWGPDVRVLDGCPVPASRRRRKRNAVRYLAALSPERVAAAIRDLLAGTRPRGDRNATRAITRTGS